MTFYGVIVIGSNASERQANGKWACVRCALHTHIRTQIAIIETEQKKKLTGKWWKMLNLIMSTDAYTFNKC